MRAFVTTLLLTAAGTAFAQAVGCPSLNRDTSYPGLVLQYCMANSATGGTSAPYNVTAPAGSAVWVNGTQCYAACAGGMLGMITFKPLCVDGTWRKPVHTCHQPRSCPPIVPPPGVWVEPRCRAGTTASGSAAFIAHHSLCNVSCLPSHMGTVTPPRRLCYDGTYEGPLTHTCVERPCMTNYSQPMYNVKCPVVHQPTVSGAPGLYVSPPGSSCSATCPSGYVGYPRGSVVCKNAQWTGSYSGCEKMPCEEYKQEGYSTDCSLRTAHNASCNAKCAAGYVGIPTGSVRCDLGTYVGKFSGCSVKTDTVCTAAYEQAGYTTDSANCSSGATGGKVCHPTGCAAGYSVDPIVGSATGWAKCAGGQYVGAFRGCKKASQCSLPGWMCDNTAGAIRAQFAVSAYASSSSNTANAVLPRNCAVEPGTFVKVACAKGYSLASGTLSFGYCASSGSFVGGWSNGTAAPTCGLVEQAPCICGKSGETRSNMVVTSGAIRASDSWNGPAFSCFVSPVNGKQEINCFCRCSA